MIRRLTWAELRDKIDEMPEEQQNTDVTMFDGNEDEFYRLCELKFTEEDECDVLDPNHPYLTSFE